MWVCLYLLCALITWLQSLEARWPFSNEESNLQRYHYIMRHVCRQAAEPVLCSRLIWRTSKRGGRKERGGGGWALWVCSAFVSILKFRKWFQPYRCDLWVEERGQTLEQSLSGKIRLKRFRLLSLCKSWHSWFHFFLKDVFHSVLALFQPRLNSVKQHKLWSVIC